MPNQWRPISEAPKDGTVVDLWIVDQDGDSERVTDARYVAAMEDERPVWDDAKEGWRNHGEPYERDGWVAPGYGYDGETDWCDQPEFFNKHPRQNKLFYRKPTHFMFLPDPPDIEG